MGKKKPVVPVDGPPGIKRYTLERFDYNKEKLKANLTLNKSANGSLAGISKNTSLRRGVSLSDLRKAGNQANSSASQGFTQPAVPVSNEFGILPMDDFDDNIGDASVVAGSPKPKKTSVKKSRCPPITVRNKSVMEINRLVSRLGDADKFRLRNLTNAVQIKISCSELYNLVTKELKNINAEFFSHSTPDETALKIVLSGLPALELDELEAELGMCGVHPRELKILSKSKDRDSALYLLNFTKGSVKLTELREIKAIFNVVVWWRYYTRKKTDVIQCFRCQKFGHGSRHCNMPVRCVKCGESHGSNECQLPTKAELEKAPEAVRQMVKCANCNQNHTANFKDCTARQTFLKNQEKKAARTSEKRPTPRTQLRTFTSTLVNPNVSFAGATAGAALGAAASAATGAASGSTAGNPQITAEDDLFTMSEFLSLAREMYSDLKKCTTREEQFFALHELMVKYIFVR